MAQFLSGRIETVRADITRLEVEAVVNAANSTLMGGGGVDGAIHRAAGPQLLAECRGLGGARPGEAKITRGYLLPAKWVIHAVGPVWRGGDQGEDEVLANCYRESLKLAVARGIHSLAFPAISTGAFGFPIDRATRIALSEVRSALEQHPALERVVFCCFSERDLEVYDQIAQQIGC